MTNKLYDIGDVLVHYGEPEEGNPYRGHSLIGNERVLALRYFRDGKNTDGYTFWYAPVCGGAERITDPKSVNWSLICSTPERFKESSWGFDKQFITLEEWQEYNKKVENDTINNDIPKGN